MRSHDERHLWWTGLDLTQPPARARHDPRSVARPDSAPAGTTILVELRNRLADWEASAGDPLAAHHDRALGRYLSGLAALVEREPDRTRAALLAALALGPRDRGLPGAADLAGLVRPASETTADVLDLAIAWGCGWRRPAGSEPGWRSRWTAALLALAGLAGASIRQAVAWLRANVPDVRTALRAAGDVEVEQRLESHSHALALELATGGCRCGHGSRSACAPSACGRHEHRLDHWRPEVCRLRAFVATAVRGSARPGPLAAGAFAVSMLSSVLRTDHLVLVDTAEFRVCGDCNADVLRVAAEGSRRVDLTGLRRGLYDVGRCPSCERPPDGDGTYRTARKNWFVVPAEWGGRHQPARRYRCTGCGNLFSPARSRCPTCGRQVRHPDRLTHVWVRLAGLRRADESAH